MDNYHLDSEIKAFWGDIKATEDKLSYERKEYAKRLKNGLGEDFINYLNTPPIKSKWCKFKMKILNLFK